MAFTQSSARVELTKNSGAYAVRLVILVDD